MDLAAGIQLAQLALKHRQNKKQQQYLLYLLEGVYSHASLCFFIFFFCLLHFHRFISSGFSPIKQEKKTLESIGRKLKKNSVPLDIVNFSEEDDAKTEKLDALLAAVNNNDTSHIVHVPPGPNALSDVLIRLGFNLFPIL